MVSSLNSLLRKWPGAIIMGDYKYTPEQLYLGDLKGNRFALALRLVNNPSEETIKKSMIEVMRSLIQVDSRHSL